MAGNGLIPHTSRTTGPTAHGPSNRPKPRGDVGKYDLDTGWQQKDGLSWAEVAASVIADAITAVTDVGDALMFSRTSDGGAYSITVMSGGKSAKVWPSDAAAAADILLSITQRAQGG
jgi:hypothetical protein